MTRAHATTPLTDPAAGMERMKELTRRLLSVPKNEVVRPKPAKKVAKGTPKK
jgi:hypothetical protein